MPDPKRHNIVISTSSGTALLAFGDQPGSATEGIRIPSGQLPFKIDRDMVGESIEDSLWINGTAASFITLQVLVES